MVAPAEWISGLPVPTWRRRAIPLADSAALRRALQRTTLVRVTLALLLIALSVLAVWRAVRLQPHVLTFLPRHTTTVVVIDQSKSIYVPSYRRVAAVLRKLIRADVPVGLVAFSDTAYEMMPPGVAASALKPLLRFYTPSHGVVNVDPGTLFATAPWENVFSGGTKISSGIDLASAMLHRDHIANGTILLLSDLGTAGEDQVALGQALIRVAHDPSVHLRVVPLFPADVDLQFFEQYIPRSDIVRPSQLRARSGPVEARTTVLAVAPWPFLVAGGFLLLALAANELVCGRLQIPRPQAAS